MDLAALRSRARSYFDESVSPAHDWHHVQRVESLAERLLDAHPDADEVVVRTAVLLHDVGRAREDRGEIDDHADWGAEESRRVLADFDVAGERIDAVASAIRAHRYSNDREPATLEGEILCDADNLDALGAVGLARCFTYGGELGRPIHDPDRPSADGHVAAGTTGIDHIREKLLSLPDRTYTDAGRAIAADRVEYVEEFLSRFEAEVAGRR